jgi:hypothetical protein
MRKAMAGLFAFSLFGNSGGQGTGDPDRELLRELNATFIHNFVTNDTVSHSRIIHDDFVYISSSGRYVDRASYLDEWLHGFDGYVYWDYRDERIAIFGNTALVHATNKYIVERDGQQLTGMCMYTDIYLKENKQWKCIQAQITPVAPENAPGDETIIRKYDFRKQKN